MHATRKRRSCSPLNEAIKVKSWILKFSVKYHEDVLVLTSQATAFGPETLNNHVFYRVSEKIRRRTAWKWKNVPAENTTTTKPQNWSRCLIKTRSRVPKHDYSSSGCLFLAINQSALWTTSIVQLCEIPALVVFVNRLLSKKMTQFLSLWRQSLKAQNKRTLSDPRLATRQ